MQPIKKLALLLAATLLVRGLVAASAPLLAVDAYYWLWGQYPAAGYFDHPPMTGLMNALANGLIRLISGGEILGSTLAARSAPLMLGLAAIAALYLFVRDLYGNARLAWRAAALFALTPIFIAMGISVQPDNSLILFMILTWGAFWRALNADRSTGHATAWWFLAGLMAGGALLSKFHAWILLPPLWGFLVISPTHRRRLKTPGPWLALAIALAVLSPNLVWNARHDWMNYAFQWHRSGLPESRIHLNYVGIFLGGALASLTPLGFAGALASTAKSLAHLFKVRLRDDRTLFLLCAGLPLPLFLGLLSFGVKISLHWPSCGYIALMILMLAHFESGRLWGTRWHKALWISIIAFAAVCYSAPLLLALTTRLPRKPVGEKTIVSLNRLHVEMTGLLELANLVRGYYESANDDPETGPPTVIMAPNWHLTSLLAFHTGYPRECFALDATDAHNYRLWMAERGDLKGANAIVVIPKSNPNKKHSRLRKKYDKYHRYLNPLFESVEPLPSLVIFEDASMTQTLDASTDPPRLREFLLFHCRGFKGQLHKENDR